MVCGAALPDAEGSWSRETSLRGDILLLEQIEALEDRVASASMRVMGWKLPSGATSEMNLKFRTLETRHLMMMMTKESIPFSWPKKDF
jgi:hypothetical protein